MKPWDKSYFKIIILGLVCIVISMAIFWPIYEEYIEDVAYREGRNDGTNIIIEIYTEGNQTETIQGFTDGYLGGYDQGRSDAENHTGAPQGYNIGFNQGFLDGGNMAEALILDPANYTLDYVAGFCYAYALGYYDGWYSIFGPDAYAEGYLDGFCEGAGQRILDEI